ncbi:MFS domain-containing protein [Mycena indigotica]|uniref:MFS domain-containing protein n=1 Tax=Mycena indigotica TaxID=2126181 RepID=A0A8H6W5G1_9AGAR|nr:MFS domain-containing protein [Mycena indigotica]KAF7306494.1 MFS domain-containing protein [Mycena indigotica]
MALSPPLGLKWRSSYAFTTFVVGIGVATDLVVYSIVVPVVPFQLERLGYHSVSALAGWLLFAYSAGLVICSYSTPSGHFYAEQNEGTIPIAMFSERYQTRRAPLILGLLILVGSQIMFMEAPNYAVMCIARVLQGCGSTMVWVVGLALLCDCTPEQFIGRQLGLAMVGMSVGFLAGPPIGGAVYSRWGWRGPFIFGIIMAMFDLVGRLFIIERKDALKYGFDPAAVTHTAEEEKAPETLETPTVTNNISLISVIVRLCKSSRALVTLALTGLFGLIYSAQEPTLPLHLQSVWGLDSAKVGQIYIASIVPTLFSAPLSGFATDKLGVEWLSCICFALSVPWWAVLIVRQSLVLFIVALALGSFFVSGVISPLMVELATVARQIDDGHVYGSFNLVYGIGLSLFPPPLFTLIVGLVTQGTTLGPVIGGQMYAHLKDGWTAIMILTAVVLALCCGLGFMYIGDKPLGKRLLMRQNRD